MAGGKDDVSIQSITASRQERIGENDKDKEAELGVSQRSSGRRGTAGGERWPEVGFQQDCRGDAGESEGERGKCCGERGEACEAEGLLVGGQFIEVAVDRKPACSFLPGGRKKTRLTWLAHLSRF